ncbi:MAG: carboxypeptidase-like regulatory domain-containing protein, partial [Pyrinomonadaceae bacterium]
MATEEQIQNNRSRLRLFAVALMLFASSANLVSAQEINSTIAGYVYDESKAVIQGATVLIESTEIGVKRSITTSDDGYFSVPNLPVGVYTLTIEAEGFARYTQTNLKADVGKTFSLAVTMSVKQQSAEVTVTAEAYQTLNKDNANIETLISGTQVTELALNGRNWVQLVNLAPGT